MCIVYKYNVPLFILFDRDEVPSQQLLAAAAATLLQLLLPEVNLVQLLQELVMMLPEGLGMVHLQGPLMMHKGLLLTMLRG